MLSQAQLQSLRTYLDANLSSLQDEEAASAMNVTATPDYFVWKSSVSRSEIYHQPSATGSFWNWTTYKGQGVAEQNAWTQMFMGDAGPIGNLNFRQGILSIFTGSAAANTQRDHCFASGKRKATVAEKLLAIAVTNPPANTGNDSGQPRGNIANPDNLGFEGNITASDVSQARNL